jgi:hypothetical protein
MVSQPCGASRSMQFFAYSEDLIATLLQCPNLRGWERSYVIATKNTRRRGRRQLEKLEAIATRLGIALVLEGGEA